MSLNVTEYNFIKFKFIEQEMKLWEDDNIKGLYIAVKVQDIVSDILIVQTLTDTATEAVTKY